MALLGAFIDSRTIAAINSNASISYAHGIVVNGVSTVPDLIHVNENVSSASSVSHVNIAPVYDATNLSLYNSGERNSTVLRVLAIYFHSEIR